MYLSIGNMSLQLLQRNPVAAAGSARTTSGPVAAVVPSIGDPAKAATAGTSKDDWFSAGTSTQTQLKISLFDKVGEALGVEKNEYASDKDFYRAVKSMFSALEMQKDSFLFIDEIEKKLGLDELGLSLKTVVTAMVEPTGEAADRLWAALEKQVLAEEAEQKKAAEASRRAEVERTKAAETPLKPVKDDLGIYQPTP